MAHDTSRHIPEWGYEMLGLVVAVGLFVTSYYWSNVWTNCLAGIGGLTLGAIGLVDLLEDNPIIGVHTHRRSWLLMGVVLLLALAFRGVFAMLSML